MSSTHRGFLVYTALVVAIGTVNAAVWIAVTGEYRPPVWATCLAAVLSLLIADQLERAWARRHTRRARVARVRAHRRAGR
ncbi:hypothetical protein [Streptomyces lavendofoliae]|uniref:Uncharacterized protein n=1 Tax=Streptomyces lavendofoliae TaxID=67314 RepID=A0A918M7S8_9ACTN|nr:hypothetical protein [Streptomyces lavendofoliae]GGU62209.1 hypothetical protein GCM10010274_58730 [Streptomyces lavendofoliae]